jgi:hypothetical protein
MKKNKENKNENVWSFLKSIPPSKIVSVMILICVALAILIYIAIDHGMNIGIAN